MDLLTAFFDLLWHGKTHMRVKLSTKVSLAIVGVVLAALINGLVACYSAQQIAMLHNRTIAEDLSSVVAAERLQSSLVKQRGLLTDAYLFDQAKAEWLSELDAQKRTFAAALAQAWKTVNSAEETRILNDLTKAYGLLDRKRDEAIALHNRGEVKKSGEILRDDLRQAGRQVFDLCGEFMRVNVGFAEQYAELSRTRVRWLVGAVAGSTVVTILLGAGLLWLFFHDVLSPLRSILAESRGVGDPHAGSLEPFEDDLHAIGSQLRSLMSDMTETRSVLERSRAQLMTAEKLALVGRLAATVAHEIRNPLTAIKMWLFSLHTAVGADSEASRKLHVISEEITRLDSIIRNFLEFSRPPAPQLQPCGISATLDKTLQLFGHRLRVAGIQLVRDDAPTLPQVLADPEQLKQVFINLLDNAAEAMEEGGEMRMSTALDGSGDGRPMIVVRFRDTGHGMPEFARQRIFEPFFTTKEQGAGLGLCTSAQIMAQHGGRIVLESSTHEGTSFAVFIPATRAETHE